MLAEEVVSVLSKSRHARAPETDEPSERRIALKKAIRTIEILPKLEYPDPIGAQAMRAMKSLGCLSARHVRSCRLIDLGGGLDPNEALAAARRFFLDTATQEMRLLDPEPGAIGGAADRWRAEIWPQTDFDDAGRSVRDLLVRAGWRVPLVRIGRGLRIFAKYPRTQIENALVRALVDSRCERLVVVPDIG